MTSTTAAREAMRAAAVTRGWEQGLEMYWWHQSVVRELVNIGEESGRQAYNVPGLASNLGMPRMDVERYVGDLLKAGVLRKCEPLWDLPGALWVELA